MVKGDALNLSEIGLQKPHALDNSHARGLACLTKFFIGF